MNGMLQEDAQIVAVVLHFSIAGGMKTEEVNEKHHDDRHDLD
jgi:hypothetical protein